MKHRGASRHALSANHPRYHEGMHASNWHDSGFRTTGAVAKELNIDLWRLLRALKAGRAQEPHRVGTMRAWATEDIERARQALGQTAEVPS